MYPIIKFGPDWFGNYLSKVNINPFLGRFIALLLTVLSAYIAAGLYLFIIAELGQLT